MIPVPVSPVDGMPPQKLLQLLEVHKPVGLGTRFKSRLNVVLNPHPKSRTGASASTRDLNQLETQATV